MLRLEQQGKDLILHITPQELDFGITLDCGQCFRFSRISGTVTRGIAQGRLLELEQQPGWVRIKDMDEMEFRRDWVPYFALDTDYAAIHAAFAEDDTLRQAVGYAPGIRVLRQDRFETLISFLISQNNNIPRIKGSIERLCRKWGEELGEGIYGFPTAERLASCGLPGLSKLGLGYRDGYLLDCAQQVASGQLDLDAVSRMELPAAREELRKIKGVGPKVAECVLLFGFGQMAAFPVDTWIKKVLARYYPAGFPARLASHAGIAQQYLFYYIRSQEKGAS